MQWEFTAEDVIKGHADYGLAEFRRDLDAEVRSNLGPDDEARNQRAFALLYDLCYCLATGKPFDQFLKAYAYDPPTCQFLEAVKPHMTDNATMLGAILQKQIMDHVAAGMPLQSAIDAVARWHQAEVSASDIRSAPNC
ncbi:MAG: hypothetical protein OHK0048_00740 [Rhodoferax sp.]